MEHRAGMKYLGGGASFLTVLLPDCCNSEKPWHSTLTSKLPILMAIAILNLLLIVAAEAQDLDPRRYVNLPVNQNFLRIAYGYSDGDVNISPSQPLKDAALTINGGSLAYSRTMGIDGKASSFDVWLPYFCASGSADRDGERENRDVCGKGDAKVRVTYNFVGAPAVELSEFAEREREIVVGTSLQVEIPTGQYDNDKLLNIGANRWIIKPEIGMSVPWRKWSFEFSAGARFFADNNDYVDGSKLEQDPFYNLQAHVIYDLTPRQWISINANYFFGGVTYKEGVERPDRQQNSRLGLTWSVARNPKHLFKFTAHTGVITRIGNDSDTYSVEWLYRWE
jgi:hypothetical protein